MARLDALFRKLTAAQGSDLHLAAGLAPRLRIHGELEPAAEWPELPDATLRELLREITSAEQWTAFEQRRDLDFAYAVPGVGRFRANLLVQQGGVGAVFRLIPDAIVPLAELGLTPAVESFAHLAQGLVLVTGPTGSGKSTTLAAVIDRINETYAKHIVTVENPVEFLHPNKRSTISQREVGADVASFGVALRTAMRQDADVILVGELRDLETIGLAITAAEMGALVFATLHTNSAVATVDRVIGSFPPPEQPRVRTMLAESLAGISAQLLLRTADGRGRAVANEVLLRTPGLPNVIREGNTPMIHSVIQGGKKDGMRSMDDSLAELLQKSVIRREDAHRLANNKKRFE